MHASQPCGRRWRFLWGMLLQQQIASSSPNYELLKFTSVHCLIQSLLQWSPIAILFVAYLHRYLHIHGDSFLKSYQTYTSHGISPLAPSSPCRIYDSFALPNLYQMSPYVKGQLWWASPLEICLNEPDRVGNWRGTAAATRDHANSAEASLLLQERDARHLTTLQWYFWQWSSGNFTVASILNLLEHSFWAASRSIAEQYSKSFGDAFPTLKDHFFLTESEQGPLCSLSCGHSLPKHKQEH